jgi:hypothetical protein
VSRRILGAGCNRRLKSTSTHLKNEHSIAVATLRLASAVLTTVVNEHATIEALAGSDSLHGIKSRSSRGSRDAAARRSARGQSGSSSGRRDSAGAGAVAEDAGDGADAADGARALAVVVCGRDFVLGVAGGVSGGDQVSALAAGVGADGEGQEGELSVLHFCCSSGLEGVVDWRSELL